MRVRLHTIYATATRNAGPGDEIEVTDEEAKQLLARRYAEPVHDEEPANEEADDEPERKRREQPELETATAEPTENAAQAPPRRRRRKGVSESGVPKSESGA